ncbi:hypothetical protein [Hyalangium rubrum]|uniref:Glycosyltransferase RgtA/B/C/D-like domain-containing protein n=1 Tax=Hyalangium rubrum TaxID=3103134 RepID=A0ABU5H6T8_9BACT|nr:hypothetical protein [Hyalangium sp. s54d21]MDY7228477.1 hypothetical protein [Hyalangium sp. s54d21]
MEFLGKSQSAQPSRRRAIEALGRHLKPLAPCLGVGLVLAWITTPSVALAACAGAALMLAHARWREGPSGVPTFVVLACLVAFQAWLVTRGTFAWDVREALGSAYDSLARSLRLGSAEVRPEDIQIEAWRSGGRTVMYFGPFPALLRVLPDLLAPSAYGLWSRASGFLALLLCLWAVAAICRRQLAANERLDARGRSVLFFASLAALGLGSPLVLLGSLANLYHEAILWGLCAALWGVSFALGVLRDDAGAWRSLALLSAATGVAFLSRVTFGLPLYVLTVGLALRFLVLQVRREQQPLSRVVGRVALALLPTLAAGLFSLWYNHARFGSPLAFAPLDAYGGPKPQGVDSAFHWSRIPSGAWAYFRISLEHFSAQAPFLRFARPLMIPRPELYRDLTTLIISPLLVSPWLVLGLAGGLALRGRPGERQLLVLCALPFAAQCVLILSYYWLAYRFTAEFLPLGVWFLAAYLRHAGAGSGASRLLSPRAFTLVVALSAVATLTSLFHFQSLWWAYPAEYRQQVSRTFEAVDAYLRGTDPPPG